MSLDVLSVGRAWRQRDRRKSIALPARVYSAAWWIRRVHDELERASEYMAARQHVRTSTLEGDARNHFVRAAVATDTLKVGVRRQRRTDASLVPRERRSISIHCAVRAMEIRRVRNGEWTTMAAW